MSTISLSILGAGLLLLSEAPGVGAVAGCKCYVPFEGKIEERITSRLPHSYLKESDLPAAHDWRNVNGTNYCSKVLTQQNPAVCGSCWAEAATGQLKEHIILWFRKHYYSSMYMFRVRLVLVCHVFSFSTHWCSLVWYCH